MSDKKLTHWKSLFNYDYLGAYSLPNEQDVTLTIAEIKKQLVTKEDGTKENCTIFTFKEVADWIKPMIVNKKNCKIIEKLYTPHVENWIGKPITIYILKNYKAFGEIIDVLRIRPKKPQKPTLDQSHKAWVSCIDFMQKGGDINKIIEKYELSTEDLEILKQTKKAE